MNADSRDSRNRDPDRLPVALVQSAPVIFDLPATLDRVYALCREAHATGAKLVVFPEAFIGGYPKGADFGVRVGSRSDRGRKLFQRYLEGALEIPSPETERLVELCRDLDITLVIGAIERVKSGTLYCCALTIGPEGILNAHRKTMPTAMERVIWGFGDGKSIRGVDTPAGRVGTAICWENYMPPLRMRLYEDHVALYCAPTVDDRDTWHTAMRHIAYEGRCFVLAACQYAKRSDFPEDYVCIQGDDPETVLIRGGSCIVDPFGEVLAGPEYGESALLSATLNLNLITQGKFDLDVAGHYSRPDLFSNPLHG